MRVFVAHDFPKRMLIETVLLRSSSELAEPENQLLVKRVA